MVHPATKNSNVSLCAVPFVGGSQDAFLKLCLCRWKREQLAFSSSNFWFKFLLCCWSETSFESSNMYMNNLGIWKMVQDQQQEHSSLSAQSPGSSIAVVLETESCLSILNWQNERIIWSSHGIMMCYECLPTSLDWLASVAVLDAAVLSVPAPFYKEKSILGNLFYYPLTMLN